VSSCIHYTACICHTVDLFNYWGGGSSPPQTLPHHFLKLTFNSQIWNFTVQCVPRRHKSKHWSELADSRASPMIQPWPVIRQPSQPSVWAYSQLAGSGRASHHHLFTTTRAAQEIWRRPRTTCHTCTVPVVCYICSRRGRPRLPAGQRAGCWVPRQLSDPLAWPPQLTAHRCLADSAHCCLSLGTDTGGLPPRAPTPPQMQLLHTSAGRGQMSSPLHIKLVNIV